MMTLAASVCLLRMVEEDFLVLFVFMVIRNDGGGKMDKIICNVLSLQ